MNKRVILASILGLTSMIVLLISIGNKSTSMLLVSFCLIMCSLILSFLRKTTKEDMKNWPYRCRVVVMEFALNWVKLITHGASKSTNLYHGTKKLIYDKIISKIG